MEKHYIGITRFSLVSLNSKAWFLSQQEDYLKKLFDVARLNDRIFLFSESLKALDKARKHSQYSVYHYVFYSDLLPDEYKNKLLGICNNYNFIYPVMLESTEKRSLHKIISLDLVSKDKIKNNDLIGLYNLDDDDFLGIDYFKYSEKYLKYEFLNFKVSYGLGMIGLYSKEKFFNVRESYFPKVNIGILSLGRVSNDDLQLPVGGSHMFIDKTTPIILDSTKTMYFWTRHHGQDTNSRRKDEFGINLSNLDSMTLVSEHEVQKVFPEVYSNMMQEKLLLEISDLDTPLNIVCNGAIKFVFDIKSKVVGRLRPLLSFKFYDRKGVLLENIDPNPIGVVLSANKNIGFYRYISSTSDDNNEIILNLPVNVYSLAINLIPRENCLKISNVRLFQLNF